ncbi:MAG: methyltransferase domain-containing protein [Verrucomicrobiales bacterium]|nr:methyltransferase domain-containing protein [Verrucomicrobiales bacterium]
MALGAEAQTEKKSKRGAGTRVETEQSASQTTSWVKPPVTAERLQQRTFDSAAVKTKVSYLIYAPAEYDTATTKRYPVMYWLHGVGGGQQGVPDMVRRFDEAIRAGKTPPMLVVFVNGLAESMWCDSKDGKTPVETVVVKELVPHIDAAYRTVATRDGRLIEGFSMGGFGAARLGFKHHEVFGSVSMLAGALHNESTINARRSSIYQSVFGGDAEYFKTQSPWTLAEQNATTVKAKVKIRQVVGDRDPTLAYNREFDAHLTKLGIARPFTVLPGVAHNPGQIYEALGEENWTFYREVFAAVGKPAAQEPAWVTREVRAPRVQFHTFESSAAQARVSFHLYAPEASEKDPDQRFPVLYWLHGTGGGLGGIGPVSAWFDRAIREGKIAPMLVVFPNGLAISMWCDSKDGRVPMETVVVKELVHHTDSTFRTIATRDGRLIEGFSMGGYGAARLGLKHPDVFAAFSCLAGGPLDLDFAGPRAKGNPAERGLIFHDTFGADLEFFRAQSPLTLAPKQADIVRGKLKARIAVGALDNTGPLNRAFSELLTKLNVQHTFTIVPGADHDTLALLESLGDENWQFYREVFAAASGKTAAAPAEQSVKPGVNAPYLAPDLKVETFIEKFETESREIFTHRERILDALGLRPGMAVADIGAGTGLFTLPMAAKVGPGGKVFAVDIVPKFLAHIRSRADAAKLANIETVLCTDRDVKLPAGSIDRAFICDTYHHFEYPRATLATLHAALREGGELVLIDFKRIPGVSSDFVLGHVRAGQEVFEAEIAAAGFEKTGAETFLTENYFTRFRKTAVPDAAPTKSAAATPATTSGGGKGAAAQRGGGARAGMTFDRVAQRHDKNGDGKVTKEEFRGPLQAFHRLDSNGDGFLSAEDFTPRPAPDEPPFGGADPRQQPAEARARMRRQMQQRVESQGVREGGVVPDAEIFELDGRPVRLASLWKDKPLVLVTASITCPVSVERCPSLKALKETLDPRVNFAVLYVKEAHPAGAERGAARRGADAGEVASGFASHPQPVTLDERQRLAAVFARQFAGTAPVYVSDIANRASQMLGTGPNSGLLIATDGKLLAKLGWYGPEEMRQAVEAKLKVGALTDP